MNTSIPESIVNTNVSLHATVLVDNKKSDSLKGEWGLSIYIEYGDQKILLDAGASDLFVKNAKQLGIALEQIDYAVLSHAHFDHANGMNAFFEMNQKAQFYLRETSEENCYHKPFLFRQYIGIPKNILHDKADRITIAKGDVKISEGVYLIPHKTSGLSKIGKREKMYQKIGKKFVPDNFSHEQSLVFETTKGLVIFNCCSHGGAANIINEIAKTFPEKKVYSLIGGFHLYNKSVKEIESLGDKIKETGIEYVCTGHCTGEKAYKILQEKLGDKLHHLQVEMKMDF